LPRGSGRLDYAAMTSHSKRFSDGFSLSGIKGLPPPPDLSAVTNAALFLDFDGTLVDIAACPDAIEPAEHLAEMLDALAVRLSGRLALVSGRSVAEIDRYIGLPGLAVAGSHGGEWRPSGSRQIQTLADARLYQRAVEEALLATQAFAKEYPGVVVEHKPMGIALHYRNRPDAAGAADALVAELARVWGLATKQGKMVVELLPPGAGKGLAVEACMAMSPFRGARPIFLGDDITDEDAFATVTRYPGGAGVLVGPLRPTAAIWHLGGVADVHCWLERALA
jgi:trehalose 6-phosphate phosphatase